MKDQFHSFRRRASLRDKHRRQTVDRLEPRVLLHGIGLGGPAFDALHAPSEIPVVPIPAQVVRGTAGNLEFEARPAYVTGDTAGSHVVNSSNQSAFGPDLTAVTELILRRDDGTFGCSGTLLSSQQHVVTAAHCVADSNGNLVTTSVDATWDLAGLRSLSNTVIDVHPSYDGDIFGGNDLAIITLTTPVSGITGYDIYSGNGEVGATVVKAGYGLSGHGNTGTDSNAFPFGTLRAGQNRYDSDGSIFGAIGVTNGEKQIAYDFDSGDPANDAFDFFYGISQLGVADEVNSASGDSGGPTFVNDGGAWKLVGVTSYGLRLNLRGGPPLSRSSDVDNELNSSFGEFSVNTRLSAFTSFIEGIVPTASVAGPSSGVPFQERTFTLTATDPSAAHQAAGFTFDIDWDGDDVVDKTVFGPSGMQVIHRFSSVGAKTVKVTATDIDGGVSDVVPHPINIARVEMQGADLVWGGTNGEDGVEFEETAAQTVEVRTTKLFGAVVSDTQTFVGISGRAIAYGGDGDDTIDAGGTDGLTNISAELFGGDGDDTIDGGGADDDIYGDFLPNVEGDGSEGKDTINGGGGDDTIYGDGMEGAADTISGGDGNDTIYGDNGDISSDGAQGNDTIYGNDGDDMLFGGRKNDTIFGGDGNDIIDGQTGFNILIGGSGNDSLTGGSSKDLLFGGAGADTLDGNGGDDLLVAGVTSFDGVEADLKKIGFEWQSSGSYATRVANIGGTPGGANDPIFLQPGITVFDDADVDTLFGGSGTDWFLDSQSGVNADVVAELEAGEVETDIAP